jgi:hypothetical protein
MLAYKVRLGATGILRSIRGLHSSSRARVQNRSAMQRWDTYRGGTHVAVGHMQRWDVSLDGALCVPAGS